MKKTLNCLVLCFLLLAPALLQAEDCLECHREKTPGAVRIWEKSAHARAGIGCSACHGNDHGRIDAGKASVDMEICGTCHEAALKEHRGSRHGMGLHSGWGCTRNLPQRDKSECRFCHQEGSTRPVTQVECSRFLKQSSEMAELGCNRCHQVESSCASCHSSHATDLAIVRDPGVCAKCHMGPDHPQWEMWQTSVHGTLRASAGPEMGPSCQDCHMAKGSHDVSVGLTMTPGGALYPEAEIPGRRAAMLSICTECHSERFATDDLAAADAVRIQSQALVKKAEAIIWDLADRGLLDPMPTERPPHPLRGEVLVTDSQMLYEETSHIERLFFKMKKYDLAKTVKGAYHQNPAYTHWYGNAELKMDLIDIEAEATRLRERNPSPAAVVAPMGVEDESIEKALEVLKNKFDRGALSAEDYAREKGDLLERFSAGGQ
ncbi:putative periplasmic multiheme cytochrome c [Desulfuromonas soudanensis]|uniref:Putative periplasmic multiheme cytochrome c n=1 Tax=Desulfuromonas soudanensis TaxID=1603606 RepID=A0A0M4DIJ5_9BACT|nr:multiheme c-type cytochrome [Desulfuromonas soudanensis]ALC16757.1 putative periplasmic multiheme cytochrome c [Desulfuromonas soudanensis]